MTFTLFWVAYSTPHPGCAQVCGPRRARDLEWCLMMILPCIEHTEVHHYLNSFSV
ncbi:hypothetical protein Krac_4714 [Ktedonobacter racemifer DSM 44963]|uniref:Uncharacterized protein n=1 Tax=Ktedonobacter racemifer DSM 44963 TaxID=485913 RepID=D6TTG8_KTERA|nr:hypothetical protein Krac_4714 [Ktedonobacter racemifer DSM 44963]